MSKSFPYEIPKIVDLSAQSATGAACDSGFDASDWHCQEGSCPVSSQCAYGSYAQWCYTAGTIAHDTTNPQCLSCCQAGSNVEGANACVCNSGSGAIMNCFSMGGRATNYCAYGGNYDTLPCY